MAKRAKLLETARNNPKGVRFEDACKLAESFHFLPRNPAGGSHRVYKRKGYKLLLNFQNDHGMAKEYQVKQLLDAIDSICELDQ
jgi:hypothetical protein